MQTSFRQVTAHAEFDVVCLWRSLRTTSTTHECLLVAPRARAANVASKDELGYTQLTLEKEVAPTAALWRGERRQQTCAGCI